MSHLYSGSLTEELMALVERNLPVLPEPKLEPWLILAHARIHLANKRMTVGDEDAWFLLGQFQDDLFDEDLSLASLKLSADTVRSMLKIPTGAIKKAQAKP